VADF